MRRKLFLYFVFICLIILSLQAGKQLLPNVFDVKDKGGLKVIASPDATVYINGLEVGKTPFQDDGLNVGEYLVRLVEGDSTWQGKITLTKGTLSVVNRSLAPGIASSSGESLVLDNGKGITITSNPENAEVEVDGRSSGKTPLYIPILSSGVHSFSISHDGYLTRMVDVILPDGLKLHIDVDLALLEKTDSTVITPTISLVQKVKIKQTPLGYLRLREAPNTGSREIAQVSSGEELTFVSETVGWVKVRLKNNLEGWVSSQYVVKLP